MKRCDEIKCKYNKDEKCIHKHPQFKEDEMGEYCVTIAVNKPAKDLVKHEVCKWEQLNETYKSDCMPDLILSVRFANYFRYCPYCGKQIELED